MIRLHQMIEFVYVWCSKWARNIGNDRPLAIFIWPSLVGYCLTSSKIRSDGGRELKHHPQTLSLTLVAGHSTGHEKLLSKEKDLSLPNLKFFQWDSYSICLPFVSNFFHCLQNPSPINQWLYSMLCHIPWERHGKARLSSCLPWGIL